VVVSLAESVVTAERFLSEGFAVDGLMASGLAAAGSGESSARALSMSCCASAAAGAAFGFSAEDVVVFNPVSPRYQHLRPALRSVW